MLIARAAIAAALAAFPLILSAQARGGDPPSEVRSSFGGYLAGRVAHAQHETDAAAILYRSALAKDPQNEILLEQSQLMDVAEGRISEALDMSRRLLALHTSHRIGGLVLGADAAKHGRFAEAADNFRLAGVSPIGEVTSTLAVAWSKFGVGDVDGAMSEIDGIKQAEWAQFYLRYHKALISDLAGRHQEAGKLFERAFRGEQRLVRLTLAYAQHALARGDRKLARSIISDHARRATGTLHPYVTALSDSINSGADVPLLVRNPTEGLAEVFMGLGEALTSKGGGIGLGTVYLQLALHLEPSSPFALAALASVYETTKRYDSAISTYDRVPAGTPIQMSIDVRKALLLNQLDRLDEAKALLERIAAQSKTDIRALDALGSIMQARKRFADAIGYYDRVIERIDTPAKQHWTLFFARGTSYERIKNWPKAEADLQRALRLAPDQASILNYLGYSWVDQDKNLRQGMEYIRKAVRLRPEDGHIVDSLGWAHYRLGNFREAVRYLERSVEIMPWDAILNDHLGDAYWRAGRRREARFQWDQALTLKPDPEDAKRIQAKLTGGLPLRAQARVVKRTNQAARREALRKKRTDNQVAPASPQLR